MKIPWSLALALTVGTMSCSGGNAGSSTPTSRGTQTVASDSDGGEAGASTGDGGTSTGDGGTSDGGTSASDGGASVAVITETILQTDTTNPDLVNAWGLAFNGTAGPAWISDNGSGKSSVYDATNTLRLTVTVPAPAGTDQSAPTGVVFNKDATSFSGDVFVFVTEDGTLAGWQPTPGSALRVDNSASGAVYKGVALATVSGASRLYATNFHAGTIDVFDQSYAPVTLPTGAFTDPSLPSGFAPFNADAVGGLILVTYAKQDSAQHDDVKGAGNGFVNAFDSNGNLLSRLASNGALNSPWGLAVTADDFPTIPHRLLVGNFGDGRVNIYDVDLHASGLAASFEGQLIDSTTGGPLTIDGLWALRFPAAVGGFDPHQLYFTAGPGDEQHGAYGRLVLATP